MLCTSGRGFAAGTEDGLLCLSVIHLGLCTLNTKRLLAARHGDARDDTGRTMRGRLRGVASEGCCSQTPPMSEGTKTLDEPLRSDGGISALPLPLAMEPSKTVLL